MNISVIGTGYVGLVTGVGLANSGNEVLCMDVDEKKVAMLRLGKSPIYEAGLEDLIERNMREERLFFTTSMKEAVDFAEIIFIAVGTPQQEDNSADLSYVKKVAESIGEHIENYKVIVNKSTVPVGTIYIVKEIITQAVEKRGKKISFDIVSNPEFLREGAAVEDFLKPDRIIIGSESEKATRIMKRIYTPFLPSPEKLLIMDPLSSEMSKYAANCMLAVKISFMNEIANICEKTGADITKVKAGIGSDPRIGPYFINAGLGYGGSCFPKDVNALIHIAQDKNYEPAILKAADKVNQEQREVFFQKIRSFYHNDLKGKVFGIWGGAFKPETDDIREAPALNIIENLLDCKASVKIYDPKALERIKEIFGDKIEYQEENMYQAVKGTDALLIVTEWQEFHSPNFSKIKKLMKAPVIFDGRNIFSPLDMQEAGFKYFSIGRTSIC
ncbi:MAG: UDP-glucose 6-dehydrogenase [Spirochaetes bacterium GWB1_36_13]|nr:MAG: UDP-glucose 6-dehydrogenase [Spirochaetes bacterium GWB1_36_13]